MPKYIFEMILIKIVAIGLVEGLFQIWRAILSPIVRDPALSLDLPVVLVGS